MSVPEIIDASARLGGLPGRRSRHVGEAVEAMSSRYRPHRLAPSGDSRQIDFRHHSADLGGATLNLLRYGPCVVIDAGSFDTFYMLEMPLTGGVDLDYGGRRISSHPEQGLLLSPGPTVLSRWRADTTQVMLRIERSVVELAYAKATGGFGPVTPVFEPEIDLKAPVGLRLARLIRMLVFEQAEAAGRAPLAAAPLLSALMETIFAHVPRREGPTAEVAGPLPWYLVRLRALLDQPDALGHSVAELARRIGVSPRTLTAGMRRFTGLTPHQYLTRRRMEHARALLLRGDMAVAEVAVRLGFANAGRFAACFRQHCGTYPSHYTRLPG